MKVLHITPHLGGGVGKAHAAMQSIMPPEVERTFVLLEAPRETRYADAIERAGAHVHVARDLDEVAAQAARADVVQFEFWNHPRMFECLARCSLPAMRSVFWSHISGLAPPYVPAGLIDAAMRFVFTTEASFGVYPAGSSARKPSMIGSAFGFANAAGAAAHHSARIAYLGTVDFVKMHPAFFDVVDAIEGPGIEASVWGAFDPHGDVASRRAAMRYPERVRMQGATSDPQAALSNAGIFFYPLQPQHYGTAENALIEAMSLGLVPVVLDNPAEAAIVRDGKTGFVANSMNECVLLIDMLLASPDLRRRLSHNAIAWAEAHRRPEQSVREFMILWLGLLAEEPRRHDFRAVLGESPADWFMATQSRSRDVAERAAWSRSAQHAKGTLAHFESVFAGDASLAELRRTA
jgi:hypothetical protein